MRSSTSTTGTELHAPDAGVAIEQYRHAAPRYDRRMRRLGRWQGMAVERLELRPGETVVDVACGTGLNFPSLESGVGPTMSCSRRARSRMWSPTCARARGSRVSERSSPEAGARSPVVNFFVRRAARPYITTFSGLDRPWRELERYTERMEHRSLALGGAYVAWGRIAVGGRQGRP